MTEHADEDLLHEVLRALPVSNGPIDEVEQPGLVAVYQGAEGLGVARQVLKHQPAVVKLVQRLALERARRRDCLALPREGCSYGPLHVHAGAVRVIKIRQEPYPSHHLRRSEEHTSELQSPDHLVCRLLLEKKKKEN